MIENMITMVRMICFSYQYSKESGFGAKGLHGEGGVSPREAMEFLFGAKGMGR